MKSFKDLASSLQLEAKATYCGRCGTGHVPPSQGGTCPALKKEEASPMVKPPKNEFGKKEDAFAHAKQYGGKVMKKTFTHPTSGMKTSSYVVVKEEVEQIDEISKEKIAKYVDRAQDDFTHQNMARRNTTGDAQKEYARKERIRRKGISRAIDRLHPQSEETEIEESFDKMDTSTLKKWISTRQRNAMGGNLSKQRRDQYDQAQAELKKRNVKEENEIEEAHQVVAKTKEGETFRSAKYPTKKQAMDMHYKMAKSNKYAKVDTVKVQEESELDEAVKLGSKVTIHAPGKDYHGKVGSVGEIRHGAYKGAPKTYTVDYDHDESTGRAKSVQLDKRNIKQVKEEYMSSMEQYLAAIEGKADFRSGLEEKKLTPAEMKKREEVAKAIERENPDMPMGKKMAIATATAKKVAEEAEELDELRDATLKSYSDKAAQDVADSAVKSAKHAQIAYGAKKTGSTRLASINQKIADKAQAHANKRVAGLIKAASRMKEETEGMHYCAKHVYSDRFGEGFVVEGSHAEPDEQGLIEWYDVDFDGTVRRVMTEKVKVMHAEYHMNHKRKMSEEDKPHTIPKTAKEKSLAALAEPKDKITHADVMVGRGVKKEETELDEAEAWKKEEKWKKSEPSPVTDKSGAKHTEMSKVKHLARMAVQKTKKEMAKEEVEQIDELSKDTLKSYMGKAAKENLANLIKPGEEAKAKAAKRFSGMMKASEKMAKEEVDLEEAMISYSDFMDKIKSHRKAGHKVVDDKYTSGKATFTTITPDGTGRKVTHTPQGHKMEVLGKMDGEDDGAAEVKPTEKRGRGRPAGSKSGARRN